jgi:hypothetical protein
VEPTGIEPVTSCLQSWAEPFPHAAIRCQSQKLRGYRPSTFATRCHRLPQVLVPCLSPRRAVRPNRVKTGCSRLRESTDRTGVSGLIWTRAAARTTRIGRPKARRIAGSRMSDPASARHSCRRSPDSATRPCQVGGRVHLNRSGGRPPLRPRAEMRRAQVRKTWFSDLSLSEGAPHRGRSCAGPDSCQRQSRVSSSRSSCLRDGEAPVS